jgi:Pyocin activator protein PrtN
LRRSDHAETLDQGDNLTRRSACTVPNVDLQIRSLALYQQGATGALGGRPGAVLRQRWHVNKVTKMTDHRTHTASTLFLLMAQYGGRTIVPIDQVCRDFFGHLTVDKLLRKALRGDIALPIVRIETSQKSQRGVHLVDLAAYIDKRRAAAVKECRQLTGQT